MPSKCASISVANYPTAKWTNPLLTNSDTTLQSVMPSMATQYQHQDNIGGFCGGWENYDHVIQVSP